MNQVLMAALVLLVLFLSGAASEEVPVETTAGGNVTLQCEAPEGSFIAVEWTRDGLPPPEYVLFYRDGCQLTEGQHSSFEGRVQLVNDKRNKRDVSLILQNVISSDEGTYECRVASGGSRRKRATDTELIRRIRLEVKDSGSSSGNHQSLSEEAGEEPGPHQPLDLGLGLGLGLAALVCSAAAVALFLIQKRKSRLDGEPGPPAAEQAAAEPLV